MAKIPKAILGNQTANIGGILDFSANTPKILSKKTKHYPSDQIAQNCDQDDRRPEPAPRRATPPDRGVAHSVRSWTPAPRLSRDPFEAA